jgi:hypothetical protein
MKEASHQDKHPIKLKPGSMPRRMLLMALENIKECHHQQIDCQVPYGYMGEDLAEGLTAMGHAPTRRDHPLQSLKKPLPAYTIHA